MTLVVTHPYVSTITESTLSGGVGGLVGPTEWNQNHTLTGLASPAQGGTGITSGTGVTYFSSATVIADSGTLTANALVVGGGANGAPASLASLGTTSTLLHGNASGNPSFGAVNLGSEVAGTLPAGNVGAAGSNTQVQFNNSNLLGADSSFIYRGSGGGVSIVLTSSTSTNAGLSIVTSSSSNMVSNASAINIAGAWNNSATTYDAPLFMNIVNTASAAGSKFMDFQVGGAAGLSFGSNPAAATNYVLNINGATPTIGTALAVKGPTADDIFAIEQSAGTKKWSFTVRSNNNFYFGEQGISYRVGVTSTGGNNGQIGFVLSGNTSVAFTTGAGLAGTETSTQCDATVFRDAATGVLAVGDQASNTTATGFRVYNTTDNVGTNTAPTNYERGAFDWVTTANVLTIGAQANGTGTIRPVLIAAGANSGTSPVVSLNLATSRVAQFGDGAANANGWMNWAGESRVAANSTTTSTALANVPGLAFVPRANRNYSFEAHLIFTDTAAGGIQCTVNATSTTTTYTLTFDGWVTDTTAVRGYAQGSAFGNVVASSLTTGNLGHVTITGTLMTSATAPSTVTIQFAQNTSNATPTTILVGSYMWAQDMP